MKLALGTVQFGLAYGIANKIGQVSQEEARQILKTARTVGIDTLDTAIAYGQSEEVLGELGVNGFKVVTKLPSLPKGLLDVEGWVKHQVTASLLRLGLNSIYALLLHRSQDLLGANGLLLARTMEQLKSHGCVQKIGISIYDPAELEQTTQVMAIDFVQAPLNLLDQRLQSSGYLKRLHDQGVEVHTRSAFLQGLLLMPRHEIPQKFERWSLIWDKWHNALLELQMTAIAACLSYPLSLPQVERVVVGVDNFHQLEQILRDYTHTKNLNFSSLSCDDLALINPSNWSNLQDTDYQ